MLLTSKLWFPALLSGGVWFPDPNLAVPSGPYAGLAALGGDFSVERLLLAYRSGLFPWTDEPITWWSPDPRAIFELDHFHVPTSLAKILKRGSFAVTIDHAFREVMEGCAESRPGRGHTWVTKNFIEAYTRLHQLGHAHSLECWMGGRLVGGIYGVAIGGFFAGESMFHRVDNASKVALARLVEHLRARDYALFDTQLLTPLTQRLGAINIPRREYLRRLADALKLRRTFL
ncbi:MAG: leucyl/phenylalanyl-tRNA--protein transferase [Verrucomicrobia bacterium]|nr:leucyl/phenylalanyl-tRNA--protein transferase [Verrucomicrobiota bacterium]